LTREACPDEARNCVACGVREGSWRCQDCIGNGCHCIQCFREAHRLQPFHRVEHWSGTHFNPAWLCQAGVEIHLGHGGKSCPNSDVLTGETSEEEHLEGLNSEDEDETFGVETEWEDEFCSEPRPTGTSPLPKLRGTGATLVIDQSGLHNIRIHPCRCPGSLPMDIQFLRMGFFPTSFINIKTVITFKALEDQRLDNLECKTAVLRYWNKLRRKTSVDAWLLLPVRFIYRSFLFLN
jgi:CxC2 like cysteine cluster associated with KDZ transposases